MNGVCVFGTGGTGALPRTPEYFSQDEKGGRADGR